MIINLFSKRSTGLLIRKKSWLTKDGEVVEVIKMTDDHLVRLLRMLMKTGEYYLFIEQKKMCVSIKTLNGDAAICLAEEIFMDLCDKEWKDCFDRRALSVLLKEAKRRDIDWEYSLWY